jgi:hypothetical protein
MGLVKSKAINADHKRLISATNKEFYDYAIEGNITLDAMHYNNAIYSGLPNLHRWIC